MATILPFLAIPLAVFISFALTMGGHFAHKLSEQVRLDALTLSLCHHRKNFIEDSIVKKNHLIVGLQNSMDAIALPCFMAIASPAVIAAPEICNGVEAELRSLEKIGKGMEKAQDLEEVRYSQIQIQLKDKLTMENELDKEFGSLDFPVSSANGFSRELISTRRQSMEALFGVVWPKQLQPNSSFEFVHTFKSSFHPNRLIVGVKKGSTKWQGLQTIQYKNLSTKAATSASGCKITSNSDDEFEVKRLL